MSAFIEQQMRHRLDGTFTHVGGRRIAVPRDFIPTHQDAHGETSRGWMTETKARAILQHVRTGATQKETARRFSVSHSTVSDISRGRTWKRLQASPEQRGAAHGH